MTERRPGAPPPDDVEHPDLSGPAPAAVFGRLFDEHAAALHRYLARRVGTSTADDLVSETFLTALTRRHSYDPARAGVRSWLYGIATNLLRNHVRAEVRGYQATARALGASAGHEEGHDGRVAARVDAETATRGLAAALARLADGDRDVLLLTSWAGLSATEVAEALGIPVGTVRSRLHRARRWLRTNAPNPMTEQEDTDD
ncbi:RNA polymerase sigma-70 factor (ECF subfamily) [Crossiella equi]|uniref:RNA polymerase sigma-70 factor (ECF subfamily) n=1 Tax=Crossiella equi TaxID=130796 RepID=A0ABS5AFX8_9PSEU|nr:RNA polymerase sigma factor [Crossiella equi]MBP2475172.1 RNA polymerase sigma-70 factor (ECF subfamily) [Crossiella equi]